MCNGVNFSPRFAAPALLHWEQYNPIQWAALAEYDTAALATGIYSGWPVRQAVETVENVTSDTRKTGKFSAADFSFDESKQTYFCLQSKALTCHARSQRNRNRLYDIYHARQEDCANCRMRSSCLSGSSTSQRYLSVRVDGKQPNLVDEMRAKIDTPQGEYIYARRLAIVEPVFANICVQKRLNHFTLRTKAKVDVQWKLFGLVHNIGKIHTYGMAI